MTDTTDKPKMLTFKQLKALGWPYCRTQTRRKEAEKLEVSAGKGKGTKIIDNPDPFPKAVKLGWHPSSPLVWPYQPVMDYLKRHGIV
jgi:hypothetical protein